MSSRGSLSGCITPILTAPYSRTEPDSFFIDVYFNAHPVPGSQDGKQKLKAPNALIPTVIAYSGGQTEFAIDMGADVRIHPRSPSLQT